jgi:Cu/Ag efflux protein CusF
MVQRLAVLSAATLLLAAAATATAKESARSVAGHVTKVDPSAKTLTVREDGTTEEAHEMTFEELSGARIIAAGKAEKLVQLRQGDAVTVKYVERNGKSIAERIDVAKAPSPKSKR